jgi:hypothetical protein
MDNVYAVDFPNAPADAATAWEHCDDDPIDYDDAAPIAPLHRTAFTPIEDAAITESDADPKPARGFLNGVLLAVPLWGLLGVATWFVLQW